MSYNPRGFGGLMPPMIKNLLIINGVVYFLQIILNEINFGGLPGWYIINKWFALNPITGIGPGGMEYNFQIWQLITYQFLHGGFSHILFNMFALWMFGMEIENLWGSKRFLIFYLTCGVAAGLFHLLLGPLFGSVGFTVGASGAIYGVLIAFAMTFPNRLIYLWFLIPIKAKYLIGFLVILDLLFIGSANDNVARLAHIGGAICGAVFILLDKRKGGNFSNIFSDSSSYKSGGGISNPFSGLTNPFKKKEKDIEEAKYYDINNREEETISQRDIDEILDKISKSGYQNLSEREKKILFEASKKMK